MSSIKDYTIKVHPRIYGKLVDLSEVNQGLEEDARLRQEKECKKRAKTREILESMDWKQINREVEEAVKINQMKDYLKRVKTREILESMDWKQINREVEEAARLRQMKQYIVKSKMRDIDEYMEKEDDKQSQRTAIKGKIESLRDRITSLVNFPHHRNDRGERIIALEKNKLRGLEAELESLQ